MARPTTRERTGLLAIWEPPRAVIAAPEIHRRGSKAVQLINAGHIIAIRGDEGSAPRYTGALRRRCTIAIQPTPEQFKKLMEGPPDTPVVMVNLLTFKEDASDDDAGVSGQEAYGRYTAEMRKFVESKGGRFIWSGRVDSMVIGESDEEFHVIGLVEYPSRAAFLEIASSDYVAKIGEHRSAGLESQWLIATTGVPFGD